MRNLYFSDKVRSEQKLYEDIIIESLKIYGQDVYYIPRDLVQEDKIFGDDVPSRFNSAHKIEMYIENVEGFDGEGDLFTKFGVEIRDEATFVVSRNRWSQQVAKFDNGITSVRPLEGDLIYLPLSKKLFEISHVEHEQPFYQLSNLPVFKLRTRLFEYNNEDLDTGVTEVDNIELDYAYKYILTLDGTSGIITVGEKATQTLSSGVTISGEIARWSDSDQKLHLIHVDTSDDKYHTFVTGTNIVISAQSGDPTERVGDSAYNVTAITEDNQLSSNEQNADFTTGADFIDFTESNPFGDVSNN